MTRGAEGRYAETTYAQWIKRRLEELGWEKQDLAAEVLRLDESGRLGKAGAEAVVRRATHGSRPVGENRDLIRRVLGLEPPPTEGELLERLGVMVEKLERVVDQMEERDDPQAPPDAQSEPPRVS